jgi:type IV pilus assembly protein PilO
MDLKNFRLENLALSTQILIFGALALGLGAVVYRFYLQGPMDERRELRSEVARLESAVAQGTAIKLRLNRFKQEVADLERRLEVLRSILPSQKETPVILQRVQEMAATSNLKIMKFTPQPTVPRAFYSDWPIRLEVQGSYNGLGEFFSKISRSARIINVDTISVKGIEGSVNPQMTLSASCTATTFVFREDQILLGGK